VLIEEYYQDFYPKPLKELKASDKVKSPSGDLGV